ncbi:hypothetical protein TNCV_3751661 [Trichonephila clavipes]|nr:hypothetical protein TNCV_3751661 [Trichonephila clavipes]
MLTPDLLLEFLREPDLVKTILTCGKCSNVMKLRPKTSTDRYVWTCRSRIDKKEGSQRSIRYGSWFSSSKLAMLSKNQVTRSNCWSGIIEKGKNPGGYLIRGDCFKPYRLRLSLHTLPEPSLKPSGCFINMVSSRSP